METRWKHRVVAYVVIAVVVVLLLLSRLSQDTQHSDNSSLIKELREKLREKDEQITRLRIQHVVDLDTVRRKALAIKPHRVAPRPPRVGNILPFNGHKLVHLDLKGAPPRMSYLIKLLPVLQSWGATGLLVEYEDTFPYDGDLSVLKSHYAYSAEEIKEFLNQVKSRGLLLIPLVQTFGHMEFVLKHAKFAHLRHVANMTTAIDPNNKGSLPLVNMIVNQVIKMHKGYVKYLHIGGDEVWSLEECRGCPPASEVYLNHMVPVIKNAAANKIIPVLWDDMMRRWSVLDLKKISSFGAELMVWAYPSQLDDHFPPEMWERYSHAFKTLWIASAFKGADTSSTNFVPIQDRIENQKSWLKIYSKLSQQNVKVNGIALTGWSRYDHYATLCELLPAGLPSLALCLKVLDEGDLSNQTLWKVSTLLGFKSRIVFNFRRIPSNLKIRDEGTFPGHEVYGVVLVLRKAYNALHSVEARMIGWFNHRQSVKSKISIYQLTMAFQRIESATRRLMELTPEVKKAFSRYYNDDMIEEWKWDKIRSRLDRAEAIKKHLKKLQITSLKTEQQTG